MKLETTCSLKENIAFPKYKLSKLEVIFQEKRKKNYFSHNNFVEYLSFFTSSLVKDIFFKEILYYLFFFPT